MVRSARAMLGRREEDIEQLAARWALQLENQWRGTCLTFDLRGDACSLQTKWQSRIPLPSQKTSLPLLQVLGFYESPSNEWIPLLCTLIRSAMCCSRLAGCVGGRRRRGSDTELHFFSYIPCLLRCLKQNFLSTSPLFFLPSFDFRAHTKNNKVYTC